MEADVYPRNHPERADEGVSSLCLEVYHLALSKYAAGREKDIKFNRQFVRHGILSRRTLTRRVPSMPIDDERKCLILNRINGNFDLANPRRRDPKTVPVVNQDFQKNRSPKLH